MAAPPTQHQQYQPLPNLDAILVNMDGTPGIAWYRWFISVQKLLAGVDINGNGAPITGIGPAVISVGTSGQGLSSAQVGQTFTITLSQFTTTVGGSVPGSGGGTLNFLRADGKWAAPPTTGGAAGGDLSGTYPNPGVAKIAGATLGSTTATAGNLLIGSGTQWVTKAVSGDATLAAGGAITLANTTVTPASYGSSTVVPTFTVDSKGRLTAAGTAVNSPDGATYLVPATVSTTDATPTVLDTVAIPSGDSVVVQSKVVARRTGGTGGTAGDTGGWIIGAVAKNIAGTVTLLGQTIETVFKDQAGWLAVWSASGGNLILTVTGATNNNVDWKIFGALYEVS